MLRLENKTRFRKMTLNDGTVILGDIRLQRTLDHDLHTFAVVDDTDVYPIETVRCLSVDGERNPMDMAIAIGNDNGLPEEATRALLRDWIDNMFDDYIENSGMAAEYEEASE